MSGKIYNKDLTFLQDQPFAESILTGLSYKKRKAKLLSMRNSSLTTQLYNIDVQSIVPTRRSRVTDSFGRNTIRKKSEKMRKAETSLVKHFCLFLERTGSFYSYESVHNLNSYNEYKMGNIIPHFLVSVDTMRNTLLATRTSRTSERVKIPSQFKKVLRECRKIQLLYGNLSRRHLSRATSKMRLPGENLLIWLESRLDVVLERSGFFGSVKAARQSVLSGKIVVNSLVVRSPGFLLQGGDIIKIIQNKKLSETLNTQLSRGVIHSNVVLPRLLRTKSFVTTLSKTLLRLNSPRQIKSNSTLTSFHNKEVKKNFDSVGASQLKSSCYTSFSTWLIKKRDKKLQPNKYIERHKKDLSSIGLHFNKLSANSLVKKDNLLSLSNNWRFIGSPHLLFSFFFLISHIEKVISSIIKTLNKDLFVGDKSVLDKFYSIKKCNNISSNVYKRTPRCSDCFSFLSYRSDYTLPTIFSNSSYCSISISKQNSNLHLRQSLKEKQREIDTSNFEPTINLIRQSFQKNNNNSWFENQRVSQKSTLQKSSQTAFPNYFGRSRVRVITELCNNILTFPGFTQFYQDEDCLKSQIVFQKANSIKKDEKDLLCGYLSDLLLYLLFLKKETICLQLKKKQLGSKNQKISGLSPVNTIQRENRGGGRKKVFDPRTFSEYRSPISTSQLFTDNSYHSKKHYNNNDIYQGLGSAGRLKPLHLEISYQSLCAVYLFPPQRIYLPIMVDLDCIAKAF